MKMIITGRINHDDSSLVQKEESKGEKKT